MDVEKILYSLIPLILIIVFSWLFSFLGSRMKRQNDEADTGENGDDRLIDLIAGQADDDLLVLPGGESAERSEETVQVDPSEWRTHQDPRAPRVTSDPIRPKWWGA